MDKYVGYLLRFISTVIVARLVSPDDIGIFSVAFVVISLGHVIRDFGVAQYLIKEREICSEKIVAAFSLMLIIAWSLFFALYFGRHAIATFYDKPEVNQALSVLALIFLFAPFGSVRIAMLRREMDFKSLAKINIASYLALHIVTIYLAVEGWGYLALAWGQIAGVIATVIGTLLYSKLPICWPSFKGMRGVIRFGANISATNIGETLATGAPDLILGRVLNMEAVGFFGRAQGLIGLFKIAVQAAVWPVVLPYFSGKERQGLSICEDYKSAINYYTAFAFPFLAVLGLASELIIMVLFGRVWLPAAPLVSCLCLGALAEAALPFLGPYLVAQGRESLNLRLQWVNTGLVLALVLVGSFISLYAAAIGFIVAQIVSVMINIILVHHTTGFSVQHLMSAVSKNIGLTVLLCLIAQGILMLPMGNVYIKMTLLIIILLMSWLGLIWIMNHPLKTYLKIGKMKRSMA